MKKKLIDLTGPEGNAFVLMGYASKYAKEEGKKFEPIQDDMMSSNYEHLLDVLMENFGHRIKLVGRNK